jgi:hypothetical protein
MGPKEDPQDKAMRMRERRISEIERDSAASANARGMTQDLGSIYGMRGLAGLFSKGMAK